jgi:hypothetical protein
VNDRTAADMTRIAELRSDIPPITSEAERTARAVLMREIDGSARTARRSVRPWWSRRSAVAAAMTVAIAAGLAVVSAVLPSCVPREIAPAANAQQLAERAARAIEKQPPPYPRKDQWLYVRSLAWEKTPRGEKPATQEYWYRGDGAVEAIPPMNSGFISTFSKDKTRWPPVLDYGEVAALPGDPDRLLAWINAKVDAHETAVAPFVAGLRRHQSDRVLMEIGVLQSRLDLTISLMGSLVSDYPLPPRVGAGLFRVFPKIDGVGFQPGVLDAAGRRGDAFTCLSGSGNYRQQIIIDSHTYHYLGSASIDVKTGKPVHLDALLQTAVVDKPWQEPSSGG